MAEHGNKPACTGCVCKVQGAEGEDKFLVAYVVLNVECAGLTPRVLRLELKKKLPHYMVPAFIISLPELPTHPVSW